MKEKVRRWRKKERKNVGNERRKELAKQRGDGEKLLESWEEGESGVVELAGQEVELLGAVGGGVEALVEQEVEELMGELGVAAAMEKEGVEMWNVDGMGIGGNGGLAEILEEGFLELDGGRMVEVGEVPCTLPLACGKCICTLEFGHFESCKGT